jgi:transposase-like protein
MEKFIGQSILEFTDRFKTDLDCMEYLAEIKWKNGFNCVKCNHTKFTIRKKNFARDCNLCHHIESPIVDTMFHRVRFGLRKAFTIAFELSATTKGISTKQMANRLKISRTTATNFIKKVRISMASSQSKPMIGQVFVDEFVFGGKEDLKQGRSNDSKKKKLILAVETTETGGIKRVYFERLKDYSSAELRKIFDKHISKTAQIKTDQWTGYKPLLKEFDITQIKSNKGSSSKEIHTIIHQVKSWLRSTFSWVHEQHIQKYLNEFSYRINRSNNKDNIFDLLINRMITTQNVKYQDITISS